MKTADNVCQRVLEIISACSVLVAVVLVVASCGGPAARPDTGVTPPQDSGDTNVTPPDTGTQPEDSTLPPDTGSMPPDTGTVLPDTGVGPDTGTPPADSGGLMCHPSQADPTCSSPGMIGCTCNPVPWLEEVCRLTPAYCRMQGICQIGVNCCGINLPPGMNYSTDGMLRCFSNIDYDIWTFPGENGRLEARYNANGQMELSISGTGNVQLRFGYLTWSNGFFWENAANWNNTATDVRGTQLGGYCQLEISTACLSLTVRCYPTGSDPRVSGNTPSYTTTASYTRPG